MNDGRSQARAAWGRYRDGLHVRAMSTDRFWTVRRQVELFQSNVGGAGAKAGQHGRQGRAMVRILVLAVLRACFALGIAVATVAVTQQMGHLASDRVPTWSWTPDWLDKVARWLNKKPPAGVNHQAVVTAALGVVGTLVGVYFATVTFVVSTTYRDATPRLRGLVTRMPQGRAYTFVYTQAVLLAIATLLLPVFGREPNRLTLSVLVVGGAVVITAFGRLRTQLYELLEPSRLLRAVHRDQVRWLKYAQHRLSATRPWRVQTARAGVIEALLTFEDLCRLIRSREQPSTATQVEYASVDPRTQTAMTCLSRLWLSYAARKATIVSLPGWCSKRPRHKDWLTASSFEVGIAVSTATGLQAEWVDDPLWLERYLNSAAAQLLGGRTVSEYSNLLSHNDDIVRRLTGLGLFDEVRLWLDDVVLSGIDLVDASLKAADASDPTTVFKPRAFAHEFNAVDVIMLSFLQVSLGLYDYAAAMRHDFPNWVGQHARGKRVRPAGPRLRELIFSIEDGLKFEHSAEGRFITSDANLQQLVARTVSAELIDELTQLVDTIEDTLAPWTARLSEIPTQPGAAAVSRLNELLHKNIEVLLPEFKNCFDACERVHRDVDDGWPNLDLDALRSRLVRQQQLLRLPIARLASRTDADLDPDRPDTFGWAFHQAHKDALDDVLSAASIDGFDDRLLQLVAATDRAGSRLHGATRRTHASVANSFRSEPLLMLLQLSGVAYAQSLFAPAAPTFDSFERLWNRLLDDDPQRVLNAAIGAILADDDLWAISAGKVVRTDRSMQAMRQIESLDTVDLHFDYDPEDGSGTFTPLRAAIASHLSIASDFEDTFVAAWLVPVAKQRGAVVPEALIPQGRLGSLIDRLAELQDDVGDGSTPDADKITDAPNDEHPPRPGETQ